MSLPKTDLFEIPFSGERTQGSLKKRLIPHRYSSNKSKSWKTRESWGTSPVSQPNSWDVRYRVCCMLLCQTRLGYWACHELCLQTNFSSWSGPWICSLGLCLSWPTFQHLSSCCDPWVAQWSWKSRCYLCHLAKMLVKKASLLILEVRKPKFTFWVDFQRPHSYQGAQPGFYSALAQLQTMAPFTTSHPTSI